MLRFLSKMSLAGISSELIRTLNKCHRCREPNARQGAEGSEVFVLGGRCRTIKNALRQELEDTLRIPAPSS